jgi:acyl-[acyl carrier protein]--UDP-N-acetylglucosamine O-acyltransferase
MKVEVRGKSIQPAYVIQESAELVSNIRHKSLESIGKQVRVESNTNEQFAQLFSLSLCLLSIIA